MAGWTEASIVYMFTAFVLAVAVLCILGKHKPYSLMDANQALNSYVLSRSSILLPAIYATNLNLNFQFISMVLSSFSKLIFHQADFIFSNDR
jgi:hypothetical protein